MIKFKSYLSLVKFSHSIFAMPFAVLGLFLAYYLNDMPFQPKDLLLIVLSMVFARNSAMGFNRYIDRDIDKLNPRTKGREIPAGVIKDKSALIFVIVNSLLFIVTTFFINKLCFFLSPIALLVILGYSLSKRFTLLCHLILGLGLSLAPIGAYIAVTAEFNSIIPVLLSLSVIFWTSGFDIIYALQDENFDKTNKLRSIPEYFGSKKARLIAIALHVLSIIFIVLPVILHPFGRIYWLGVLIYIILISNQHRIVWGGDMSKINLAFFTMNGVASMLFAFFAILSFYIN